MSSEIKIPKFEIVRKPFTEKMIDIMGGAERWEISVHEHGFVALVDVMPRLVPVGRTADNSAIVQAARTSTGSGLKTLEKDERLIRRLMRKRHTSPLEMVEVKFHEAMPIAVARQLIRHRTANVNEFSGRYAVFPDLFYHPPRSEIRLQSVTNKQGGDEVVDDILAGDFLAFLDKAESQYQDYERLIERGLSREQARFGLPLNLYTMWYWKNDLHNILHLLSLRLEKDAQKETRDYAEAMYQLIQPIVPIACQAFEDYERGAIRLSRLEIEALNTGRPLATGSKEEKKEYEEKLRRLGLLGR